MNEDLQKFIKAARDKGHDDEKIRNEMTAAGWDVAMVNAGLDSKDGLVVPPPPPAFSPSAAGGPVQPQPVVQALSTRGLEYNIMFISLAVAAISLGSIAHSTVNLWTGGDSFGDGFVSYAASALIVSLPIFGYLFLRLKKAEQADPNLRRDPSRKRSVQAMMVITFIVGIINVITFVFSLLNGANTTAYGVNGSASTTILGNFFHLLITLAIAGSIFGYYWYDEHKSGS